MAGRVLIVEDDDQARAAFARTLREAGFEVDEAEDGERGLERLGAAAGGYRLVLVDALLPGIDGAAMLRAAGAQTLGAAEVMMLTGAPEALAGRLEGLNVTQLTKPISSQALLAAVQTALAA